MSLRNLTTAPAVCVLLVMAACGKPEPSGQVVAIANGEEITSAELRVETVDPTPGIGDSDSTPAGLLRQILNRKLWAQEAKRNALDRQIAFILAKRRAEDKLLADLQIEKIKSTINPPSDAQIEAFLQKNPTVFSTRTIFNIDQISIQRTDRATEQKLKEASSLDDVARILVKLGVVSQRSRTEWNSAFMPRALSERLKRLPPGGLTTQHDGDRLIVATVIGYTQTPISRREQMNFVRDSITKKNVDAAIYRELKHLQDTADIRIQDNY